MSGRTIVVAALAVIALMGYANAARLQVTASRAELLNSGGSEADCSKLFKTQDADLPLNIVRLHAVPVTAPSGAVSYEWSLPEPNVGMLVADEDISPDQQTKVIRSLCAELGNECILTEEQLKVYDQPTILWVAPTCDEALPKNATQPYRGGKVKIGVRARSGKHKLGKGSVTVGYGRAASVVLTLNGRTGNGVAGGVPAAIKDVFGAKVDAGGMPLSLERYDFANGGGDSKSVSTNALEAQTTLTYEGVGGGKHVATVAAVMQDGSALCDNLLAHVLTAVNRISLEVSRTPNRASYRPGDPTSGTVNLRVRVTNVSDRATGSAVLFEGGGVLTCENDIKAGDSTLTKTGEIDFQHCSTTIDQPCQTDADCAQASCHDCVPAERCLTSSHCKFTRNPTGDQLGCVRDLDCSKFTPGDTCVMVLPLSSVLLDIGAKTDLITATIPLANTLPKAASVKETWTVHAKNAPDDTATQHYVIQSNPAVKP